ncbi:MAG: acyl carrier protein [Anaerobiospirillum sp.]|nr:acyl carrier protein [Anaerobiospirillum sp.]
MTDQIETQGTAQIADQIAVLCDILDMDSTGITPDTVLSSLEGWDSMAIVMLSYHIFDQYQRRVAAADIRNCTTVQQVLDLMHP